MAFSDSVELSGDNAGGVQFSINGRAGRLLGGPGEALSARLGRDEHSLFRRGPLMDVGLRTPSAGLLPARRGDTRHPPARGRRRRRAAAPRATRAPRAADRRHGSRGACDGRTTITKLPPAAIGSVLARADAPTELREFFQARGLAPVAAAAADSGELPLVDTDSTDYGPEEQSAEQKAATAKRLADMTVPEKVKAAMKGTREMRVALIRDPNKMVAYAVLSCPKLTEQEVEAIARMGNVAEDILRTIASTRGWVKNYGVLLGLTKNPRTPLALSLILCTA